MRIHLFEWEDLPWFPDSIRQGGTDYLRFFLDALNFYEPIVPVLEEALNTDPHRRIVDLCSGGGGNMVYIYNKLAQRGDKPSITLTDKFPNVDAFKYIQASTGGNIDFSSKPVDATQVDPALKGVRTMFSAAHHFKPNVLESILKGAVRQRQPIALFDGGDKNLLVILGMIIFHPIAFFLLTPFFKPFKLSRIFFTYLLPLIPLMTVWDGVVSVLRLYKPGELMRIAKQADNEHYQWKAGTLRNKRGMGVTYLVGSPLSD